MNFNEVKALIELINSSELAYFEMQTEDGSIKMDKSLNRSQELPRVIDKTENTVTLNEVAVKEENIVVPVASDENLRVITSPMVGTFYASSSPDSDAFVQIGSSISKGNTLCIIEAMKLMNEIESDYSGVIAEVLVQNGAMVEYGQPLFKIKEN